MSTACKRCTLSEEELAYRQRIAEHFRTVQSQVEDWNGPESPIVRAWAYSIHHHVDWIVTRLSWHISREELEDELRRDLAMWAIWMGVCRPVGTLPGKKDQASIRACIFLDESALAALAKLPPEKRSKGKPVTGSQKKNSRQPIKRYRTPRFIVFPS